MTERTRRKNASLFVWLRAAAIAALTWAGMSAMHAGPGWLPIVLGLVSGLIAVANPELGVLLALLGLSVPLIAVQPIVGVCVAIVLFASERYLGGHGATGYLLLGLALVGAFLGPVWAAAALAGCLLGPAEGALAAAAACALVEATGLLLGRDPLMVVVTGAPSPAIVSFGHAPASLLSIDWVVGLFKSLSGGSVAGLTAGLSHVTHVPALLTQVVVWALAALVAGVITRRSGAHGLIAITLLGAAASIGVLAAGDAAMRVAFGLPILPAASALALGSSLAVALAFVAVRETAFAREAIVTPAQPRTVSMAAEDADVDELLRLIATAEDKLASQHTTQRVVLITDMKSFSRMTEEDGSVATAKAIQRHRDLLVPLITAHHGCGKSTGGDGIVAAFESPTDAMLAAVEGQQALAAYNLSHDNERDVLVRMGLASGEVVLDNGGRPFIGVGLNLAARVMNLADGGQIFATGEVISAGASASGPATHVFGPFTLKNIANPTAIGEVLWAPDQQPRDPRTDEVTT